VTAQAGKLAVWQARMLVTAQAGELAAWQARTLMASQWMFAS